MRRNRSKPHIALFGLATLGGEPMGQGIPVIRDLFARLSEHFDITYYSFKPVDKKGIPDTIRVRQAISWSFLPGRLKFISIPFMFMLDHFFDPCDLIFAVSIYPTGKWAVFLGKILKLPVVVQVIAFEIVNVTYQMNGDLTKPWLKKITQHVCENCTSLVAVAEYQKKIAYKSLPLTREITVLPLRIDPEKFPYASRAITSTVNFIHVGYYSVVKDQDTMFDAFAKVAALIDCHLTVIGKGFDTPELSLRLNKLKIADKITFTGLVGQDDLPHYYSKSHILLHTARYETGCAVIQEAMASGVAVCGTDVGILSDIGDEYAMIVPVGDSQQLADKIIHLVNQPELYRQMTQRAYAWISQHGAHWAYRNYLGFLVRMLSEKQN